MSWGEKELTAARRHLHQNPELSCQEHKTAAWIADQLKSMKLSPAIGEFDAETSVVVDIVGAKPGPRLLWRADTDALPISEPPGKPYSSQNAGVMHACGHDVHVSVGLGLVSYVVANLDDWHGAVRFVFQPAEEGTPGTGVIGAKAMADAGVCDGIDAAFALHCLPALEVGTIGFNRKTAWAGSDGWNLTITGKQTHGAYPQKGIDPIYIAGHIITGLQSIPGRVVDARDACVVSVGRIRAGEAFNVIPEHVELLGLVRTLNDEVRASALTALEKLIAGHCDAFGATYKLEVNRGADPVINDEAMVDRVVTALGSIAPNVTLQETPSQMGAEDFSAFSQCVPSAYMFLGVGNSASGITHPIHSPHFDVDESAMPLAVDAFGAALQLMAREW